MANLPETLDRDAHIELSGRRLDVWSRRIGILIFTAFVFVGLANVFGQRPSSMSAATHTATLQLHAPGALRSGLIYEARFRIEAHRTLDSPKLVLEQGWFDAITLNSIEPDPAEQSERDGRIIYRYDAIPAGETLVVRLQLQVNPTAIGPRSQDVSLENDGDPIAHIDHDLFIYP